MFPMHRFSTRGGRHTSLCSLQLALLALAFSSNTARAQMGCYVITDTAVFPTRPATMGWGFRETWRGTGKHPMSMITIQGPNHMYLGLSNWNDALPEGYSHAGEVTLRFHTTKRPNSPAEVTLNATKDLPFAKGLPADFYMHFLGDIEMWFDLEPLRTHYLSRPAESEIELKSMSLLMDGTDWFEAPKCMLAEYWAFYAARVPYQDPDQMEFRHAVVPPRAERRRKRREARKNN